MARFCTFVATSANSVFDSQHLGDISLFHLPNAARFVAATSSAFTFTTDQQNLALEPSTGSIMEVFGSPKKKNLASFTILEDLNTGEYSEVSDQRVTQQALEAGSRK